MPIRAFRLGLDEGDWIDMRGAWARLRRMDRSGAVLVRPDRYIAFHAPGGVADAGACLADVLERIVPAA